MEQDGHREPLRIMGIDTGGSYTDAIVINYYTKEIEKAYKTMTTHSELFSGIKTALNGLQLEPDEAESIKMVSLSTTLATNAIVEGKGGRVCLFLLGYDPAIISKYRFNDEFGVKHYEFLRGRYNVDGKEEETLDLHEVMKAVNKWKDKIDAFAISGYFSVRNPSHENAVKKMIEDNTNVPVITGHELSTRLNSIVRATTVALNARLISLIYDLIKAVQKALKAKRIEAPLMLVKGDGSLVNVDTVLKRPIETILSGPAASYVGAQYLSGEKDCIVVDMGGTTTDICLLSNGRPKINPNGARVGKFQTFVESVDIRTIGTGGDSHIRVDQRGQISIGPKRVIPICLASHNYGEIMSELMYIDRRLEKGNSTHSVDFLYLKTIGQAKNNMFNSIEKAILGSLVNGPKPLAMVFERFGLKREIEEQITQLENAGIVGRIGLTPTDLLHCDGVLHLWDKDAALIGAQIFGKIIGFKVEALTHLIREEIIKKSAREILFYILCETKGIDDPLKPWCENCAMRIDHMLEVEEDSKLKCKFELGMPLVAVGAPVASYLPGAADILGAQIVIPNHFGIANAIGAAMGKIIKQVDILIRIQRYFYVVHSPQERREFSSLVKAIKYATELGKDLACAGVKKNGGGDVSFEVELTGDLIDLAQKQEEETQERSGTHIIVSCLAVGTPDPLLAN